MFSGQSRRDHTHLVRWPQFSSSEPSRSDIVEQWRQHFVSVGSQSSSVFDEEFYDEVTRRFSALFAGPHDIGGQFDGPFSEAELVGALSRCAESAVGGDGLPYSLFKVALPWWRSALLNLFNLCLSWNDVPTMSKHSVIVPVFKTGDQSVPGNYRPISLASRCLKVLEHMVHSRIAPYISPQLHRCQGGFRWGADVMVGSLIDMLSATHTFVAFVDIFKAFDTSWVEATLVELFSMVVPRRMWALIAHFLCMARSRRSELVRIFQKLGRTQVLPRAECSLRCSSTFSLMGLHGRCMMRVRAFH